MRPAFLLLISFLGFASANVWNATETFDVEILISEMKVSMSRDDLCANATAPCSLELTVCAGGDRTTTEWEACPLTVGSFWLTFNKDMLAVQQTVFRQRFAAAEINGSRLELQLFVFDTDHTKYPAAFLPVYAGNVCEHVKLTDESDDVVTHSILDLTVSVGVCQQIPCTCPKRSWSAPLLVPTTTTSAPAMTKDNWFQKFFKSIIAG